MFKSQTAASLKSDQRAATRKPLRSHGIVALEGAGSLDIDTIDISAGGVCISSAQQLAAGQRCVIKFDMLVNGRKCSIAAVAKISYCVYGGNVGFKSGLQFIEIDPACVKVIVAFVNS